MAFNILVPPARSASPGPGTVGGIPATATGFGIINPVANPSPGAGDWRAAVLREMGVPVSDANLKALSFWHQSEGTALATNNWLAISDGANKWPHAGCLAQCGGGSPIYAFPDQATGAKATAAFLRGSYYTRVMDAFRSNAGLGAIFAAINASPWCAGCQSGHYPVALYNAIGDPNAPDPGPGQGGGAVPVTDPSNPYLGQDQDPCLIGNVTMPGPIPNIPCLFYKSWGYAILGGLAMVGGTLLMAVGGILLVTKANTVGQAVGTLGGPLGRAATAGGTSGSLSRSGSVRPLQTADEVAENSDLLRRQTEVENRGPEYREQLAAARRSRYVDTGYRPRRPRATRVVREPAEEPF